MVGTTDRKKNYTRKTARGLRREGNMLARFFCSSTLTESLAQAGTGRNVAQSRYQGLMDMRLAGRENGGKAKNCRVLRRVLARCIGISI